MSNQAATAVATTKPSVVRVGVGVVVKDPSHTHKVVCGIRKGSHGAGTLALPGGHLELYETWEECACREVLEECDLKLHQASVRFGHVTNDPMPAEEKHYVTIFMMAECIEKDPVQDPKNLEPEKCEGWHSYTWEELQELQTQQKLFGPLDRLVRDSPSSIREFLQTQQKTASKASSQPPLTSGFPPWHSSLFVGALAAVTVTHLPTLASLDDIATLDQFTHRVFPEYLSLRGLAIVRLLIAAAALSLTLYFIFFSDGWLVYANYKPQSKLRRDYFIPIKGFGTLCPFTSWCWCFLGLAFLCNGSIALAVDLGQQHLLQPWMLRTALILSETSFPLALLVSTAVKYAIWPAVLAGGRPHKLAGFRNQLQHNCNSIFALLEVALLGGVSVDFRHLSLATMVGIVYILFSWIMAVVYYGNQDVGPQYLYWFQDTTLEGTTTVALVALLTALTTFFGIFAGIEMLIEAIGDTLPTKLAFVIAVSAFVCRFR